MSRRAAGTPPALVPPASTPASAAPPAGVRLRIERLTVEGLGPASARRLGGALERRLGALLEGRGVPAGLGRNADLDALDLGDLGVPLDRVPERAGEALAGLLYDRLQSPSEEEDRP